MFVLRDWQHFDQIKEQLSERNRHYFSLALGNFDGLHLGHQKLIGQMVEETKKRQGFCGILSFAPHPMEIVKGCLVPKLMTVEQKEQTIRNLGVDCYLLQDFDTGWAQISAQDFVERILYQGLHVDHLYVGFNHSFGYLGQGNAHYLEEMGRQYGFAVTVIGPVKQGEHIVSSTAIREALSLGDIVKVNQMLGYPFQVSGEVVKGRQLGHVLGFPTANVLYPQELQMVLPGVYAVQVEIDGETFPGVANCGYQPTIDTENKTMILEVHILDKEINLYGKQIRTCFLAQIRSERHFDGLESLKKQIALDCEKARAFFEKII